MVRPLIKKADSCILSQIVVKEKVVVEKIASSGINLTVVPVLFVVPTFFKSESKCPPSLNEISYLPPSRYVVTFIHFDKALTTDAPTP